MMASICNTLLLACFFCTITLVKLSSNASRIVGGSEVEEGQFPYQVSLKYNGNHRCGGSIVNPRYVVTAGHCVVSDNSKLVSTRKLKIIVGTTSKSGRHGLSYSIAKIFLHSNYSMSSVITNDIAVLRIRSEFRFNKFVQAIPLAERAYTPDANCTISGWGRTHSENTVLPEKLQYTAVKIVSRYDCEKWLYIKLAPDMLCAGYYTGGKDACQGDSGGPLVCNNSLTGVVSHGAGCALPKRPGIYTDVHHHTKWILNILESSSVATVPFTSLIFAIIILRFTNYVIIVK